MMKTAWMTGGLLVAGTFACTPPSDDVVEPRRGETEAAALLGTLERAMWDDFASGQSGEVLSFKSAAGRRYPLAARRRGESEQSSDGHSVDPETLPTPQAVFARVSSDGYATLQDVIQENGALKPEVLSDWEPEPQTYSVAVVHVSFSDMEPLPVFDVEGLPDLLDVVDDGLTTYTRGSVLLDNESMGTGERDIFPVLLDGWSSESECNAHAWENDANQAVLDEHGVAMTQFDWVLYYVPDLDDCFFGGVGGGTTASILQESSSTDPDHKKVKTTLHEIGHMLGRGHATNDPDGDGSGVGYGDWSSLMGGAALPEATLNGAEAMALDLFNGEPLPYYTSSQDDVVRMTSLHSWNGTDRPRVLRVYGPEIADWYYVSFRTDEQNYSGLPSHDIPFHQGGVSIHRDSLDPGFPETLWVDVLRKGQSYDFVAGPDLTIRLLDTDTSDGWADVEIDYGFDGTWQSLNQAPVAMDVSASSSAPTRSVVLPFEDLDGPKDWTIELLQQPQHALSVNWWWYNGTPFVSVRRTVGYVGEDSLTWQISDGVGVSNEATVSLTWQ